MSHSFLGYWSALATLTRRDICLFLPIHTCPISESEVEAVRAGPGTQFASLICQPPSAIVPSVLPLGFSGWESQKLEAGRAQGDLLCGKATLACSPA